MESNKALVAFLDILGYEDFIKKYTAEEYAEIINKSLSICDVFKKTKEALLCSLAPYISVHVLSDSWIIVLDLNAIPEVEKILAKVKKATKTDQNERAQSIITSIYFSMLSTVVVEFISRTGFLLRGAIEYGDYAIMPIRNGQDKLIHSKALARAHNLEKIIDLPRIAIAKSVLIQLGKLSKTRNAHSYIIKDCDGINVLDLYKGLRASHWKRTQRILNKIKRTISLHAPPEDDQKKYRKYAWFQNFHNNKIAEFCRLDPRLNANSLTIPAVAGIGRRLTRSIKRVAPVFLQKNGGHHGRH
ncbi:MAG: hypothetical protein WC530_04870 [Candidatus Omnitrophota bacterium]|jgi:hypothetical protein